MWNLLQFVLEFANMNLKILAELLDYSDNFSHAFLRFLRLT